jgi:kynurenine formamidase
LTHELHPEIPIWPGNPLFEIRNLARHAQGYYANAFSCAEHTGTHVDAPIHFVEGRRSMHEVPASQLVGEACVIDVRDKVARNPDYLVSARDIATLKTDTVKSRKALSLSRGRDGRNGGMTRSGM